MPTRSESSQFHENLEELEPQVIDELYIVIPAGVAIAALSILGYGIRKRAGKRERIERAHESTRRRRVPRK